jgi:hypothetical protein
LSDCVQFVLTHTILCRTLEPEWPDYFVKKIAKNVAK